MKDDSKAIYNKFISQFKNKLCEKCTECNLLLKIDVFLSLLIIFFLNQWLLGNIIDVFLKNISDDIKQFCFLFFFSQM